MPLAETWLKVWIYLGFVSGWTRSARPRFDASTDMGLVLVPADAEVDSAIFRLRATDQDANFPLIFDVTAATSPVVRIENLPCTLYNKVCQANVILTRRLVPGRFHDFAVRVRDSRGDSNSMQATISVTNVTTPRDTIFPHVPSLIMVPEDTKPGKELDYLLVRSNPWSGKPVYIELWQPKELFTIRQRQTPSQTRGVITLNGELDFETQSMYTLTLYATDPYTEPGKDTRNIAGLHVVVVVQDVQDVPPVFTVAPPLTRINNTIQVGDVILRVHAEDGDKGSPREIIYGLVSEGNPFTPFFNISETTGEIILARSLEELTQITHVGAPIVLSVVAEEIRRSREEPPAQATVVELGLLLGEPGNSPPYFESDSYVAWMEENAEPGTMVKFSEPYSARVKDEDIGKAGVFALKLEKNNGTFEISPAVAERNAEFFLTVRDNTLIDYETYESLQFKIVAQEVGPASNLSAMVPVTIFLRDVNDNPPEFERESYEVTLTENATAGTKVTQVRAVDKDTGKFGSVRYTRVLGPGGDSLTLDPGSGWITVAADSTGLDREITASLRLSVEARDEEGEGLRSTVPLIINLLDVNDNEPIFESNGYEFTLNSDLTNFTAPAIIKAIDADAEPPNNEVRYELIHGNYDNKFFLNERTGELILREPVSKIRRTRHSAYQHFAAKFKRGFLQVQRAFEKLAESPTDNAIAKGSQEAVHPRNDTDRQAERMWKSRKKRADDDVLYILTARAYDLGVPHLSSVTQIRVLSPGATGARTVTFVVPGQDLDPIKTAETLATITGGRVTIQEIRPYVPQNRPNGSEGGLPGGNAGKKSIVVARVEQSAPGTSFVDVQKIRDTLAAFGVGIIAGMDKGSDTDAQSGGESKPTNGLGGFTGDGSGGTAVNRGDSGQTHVANNTVVHTEEVMVYKAENKLLFWLLILLGLLMALAVLALILCCICPGCPYYMAPRKRRVHSSETLILRSDGRPKRHLNRKHAKLLDAVWSGKKQAWSADPTRRNWQFNRRNTRNRGLASLPGDVIRVPHRDIEVPPHPASLRLRDGATVTYVERDPNQRLGEERIYIEDVEGQGGRGYDLADMDSIRRHELERGSDIHRQSYGYADDHRGPEELARLHREHHFYRDGNAEVLRFVTRGQLKEDAPNRMQGPPESALFEAQQAGVYRGDGKDILLRRFIEDQKMRQVQEAAENAREIRAANLESYQHPGEPCLTQQREIILLPERLDRERGRQHIEELTPGVQRLIIDHGDRQEDRRSDTREPTMRDVERQEEIERVVAAEAAMVVGGVISKAVEKPVDDSEKDRTASNVQLRSGINEMELVRQNALLTQLLLGRDSKGISGAVLDANSYLETQSLPGQVAIATQTDRTAATQTERCVRSRSDNDESEEEAKIKKKLKFKKRYEDGDLKRIKSLWVRSPVRELNRSFAEKRATILRRKAKDARDARKSTLEPEVLREISDSLEDNGSSPTREEQRRVVRGTETWRRVKTIRSEEEENERFASSTSPEEGARAARYGTDYHAAEHDGSTSKNDSKTDSSLDRQRELGTQSFRILEKKISSLKEQVRKLGDERQREDVDDECDGEKKRDTSRTRLKGKTGEETRHEETDGVEAEKAAPKRKGDPKEIKPLVKPISRKSTSDTSPADGRRAPGEDARDGKSKKTSLQSQDQTAKRKTFEKEKEKSRKQLSGVSPQKPKGKMEPGSPKAKRESKDERKVEIALKNREGDKWRGSSSQEELAQRKSRMKEVISSRKVTKAGVEEDRSVGRSSIRNQRQKERIESRRDLEEKSSAMDLSERRAEDKRKPTIKPTARRVPLKKSTEESTEESSKSASKISKDSKKDTRVTTMDYAQRMLGRDDKERGATDTSEQASLESSNEKDNRKENKRILSKTSRVENLLKFAESSKEEIEEEASILDEETRREVRQLSSKEMAKKFLNQEAIESEQNLSASRLPETVTEDAKVEKVSLEARNDVAEVEKNLEDQDALSIEDKRETERKEEGTEAVKPAKDSEKPLVTSEMVELNEREGRKMEEKLESSTSAGKGADESTSNDISKVEGISRVPEMMRITENATQKETEAAGESEREDSGIKSKMNETIPITDGDEIKTNVDHEEKKSEEITTVADKSRTVDNEKEETSFLITKDSATATVTSTAAPSSSVEASVMTTATPIISSTKQETEKTPLKEGDKAKAPEDDTSRKVEESSYVLSHPPEKVEPEEKSVPTSTSLEQPGNLAIAITEKPSAFDKKAQAENLLDMEKDGHGESAINDKAPVLKEIDVPLKNAELQERKQSLPGTAPLIESPQSDRDSDDSDSYSDSSSKTMLSTQPYRTPRRQLRTTQDGITKEADKSWESDTIAIESIGNEEPKIRDAMSEISETLAMPVTKIETKNGDEKNVRNSEDKKTPSMNVIPSTAIKSSPEGEKAPDVEKKIEGSESEVPSDIILDSYKREEKNSEIVETSKEKNEDKNKKKIQGMKSREADSTTRKDASSALSEDSIALQEESQAKRDTKSIAAEEEDFPRDSGRVGGENGSPGKKVESKSEERETTKEPSSKGVERKVPLLPEKSITGQTTKTTSISSSAQERAPVAASKELDTRSLAQRGKLEAKSRRGKIPAASDSSRSREKDEGPSKEDSRIKELEVQHLTVPIAGREVPETGRLLQHEKAPTESSCERDEPDVRKGQRRDEKEIQPGKSKPVKEKDKEPPAPSSEADKSSSLPKAAEVTAKDPESSLSQSRHMSWYKQKRAEMERKRREKKEAEEEEQRPRWMRRNVKHKVDSRNYRKLKKIATPEVTPKTRRKIKPLVNVESEQLKAIVRQGRKLRKAEGATNEDLQVEIFAPEKPPSPPPSPLHTTYHPLVQHSEYKYERIPPPFYLHPPPVPHPSPQISPEHFQGQASDGRRPDDDLDSGIAVSLQGGRLRHQQLLEKKSVFDIAYSEAAPSQLRADSTTPPS